MTGFEDHSHQIKSLGTVSEKEIEMGPNKRNHPKSWMLANGRTVELCSCSYIEPCSLPFGDCLLREGGNG